jgi:TolB-like protein/Tfp pilus assembly protein PilF
VRHALGDGEQQLIKTLPRHGYQFVAPVSVADIGLAGTRTAAIGQKHRWRLLLPALAVLGTLAAVAALWPGKLPAPPEAPPLSIVVLPLASRHGDAAQDHLAEAMAEEISVDLSRIPGSTVIARSSAERYRGRPVDARQVGRELGVRHVLAGSLDRIGDDVQLSLQLIDAASGRAVWAERFDAGFDALPALHQRITGTVAQSLHLRLVEAESVRAGQQADAGALDLAYQAWSLLRRRTPESVASARELLQRSTQLDPQSALAWALLAKSYSADVSFRSLHLRGASREQWLQRAEQAADRAYALDPRHALVVGERARVLAMQGRAEPALDMLQRQIALNRNDAQAWLQLSYTYATLGRQAESIDAGREAIRLSPQDSELSGFYVVIAAAYLYRGEDAQALQWARRSALERPDFSVAHAWVASAAALAGDMPAASAALAEFRRLQPTYRIGSFRAERLCANDVCRDQRERYYAGLKSAGLPD